CRRSSLYAWHQPYGVQACSPDRSPTFGHLRTAGSQRRSGGDGNGRRSDRCGQFRLAPQELVDGGGRCAALSDGPDNERLATTGVPGDEHPGHGCGVTLVTRDPSPFVDLDAELLDESLTRPALETECEQHQAGRDDPLGPLDRLGMAVAAHDVDQTDVADLARARRPVGEELDGGRAEHPLAAL